MKRLFYPLSLIIWLALYGCSNIDESKTISFTERVSFSDFPAIVNLDSCTVVDTKTIGNIEFRILDSLMVIGTTERNDSWKIRSINKDTTLLEFISVGEAPNEFVVPPLISSSSFVKRGEDWYAVIPDTYRGQLREINLSASINAGLMRYDVIDAPRLNNFSVYSNFSDSSINMFVTVNPSKGKIERSIIKDNKELAVNSIQHLNEYAVDRPDQIGLLMPNVLINIEHNRIVEVLDLYPQINIYSFDDTFVATIMPEGKIESYDKYLEKQDMDSNPLIYNGANRYDDFFVINKIGEINSELWFSNWNGKPLLKVKLPELITSFDIDFKNESLYTLNFNEDKFKKYDLKDVFNRLGL